ncbi:peptidase S41 [Maribellus sp. CM-23]|uniref:S41 family peptidase n=1 Tax=Maribellus sp. CM-23 TaxID=2781026 RepID=UPI001F19DB2B|nr:S41 family peptidase [Maribellus sp. CM-23]MCE4564319.1 peptidase S41 [Maribellus sp. CM-23]
MKNWKKLPLLLMLAFGIFWSCSEEEVPGPSIPDQTLKVNRFINDAMDYYYLWYDKMPNINYSHEADSKEYFKKLLYQEDKWSFITDDLQGLLNSFEGIETSFGWSLAFYLFPDKVSVFAVVEYVYPHTPAANAGLKRGDIILKMNNASITTQNYTDLMYAEDLDITLGVLNIDNQGKYIISPGTTAQMTALELQLNPVLKTAIIEEGNHKIGYLFYAQYIDNYNSSIDTALQSMIDNNVTDLVLDIRYNPGGIIFAAQHLCSSLAPLNIVNQESKLVTFQWNTKRQKEYVNAQELDKIQVNFDKDVDVKMGLDKIHILTGDGTASASELTITGLDPYMTVTTVGDTTYGKYTASRTLSAPESHKDYDVLKNWGLQPIILRYANALGETDFKDGFVPDILVDDDLLNAYPLGDVNDPLFKAAIEDITGSVITAKKSAETRSIPYKLFDRGFSKYDKNKRNLLIDDANKQLIREQLK